MPVASIERLERVTGPYCGFFVAAYAVESGGSFYGYAKICRRKPHDVWGCAAFDKVTAPASASAEGAVLLAERRARHIVRALSCDSETSAGGRSESRDEPRQNSSMRLRALLPTSPSEWLTTVVMWLALLLGFIVFDGMACSGYAKWSAPAEAGSADALYRPAELVDGKLCTGDGHCTSAVLVEGLLSTDTLAQLEHRARASSETLTVCFNSPGGTYEAGAVAGKLPSNLRTCVPTRVSRPGAQPVHALCASACAWIWMAGTQRVIYGNNSVGFHAPYEYDATACVPGNKFKGVISAAMGWVNDLMEPRYDDRMRAARSDLRLASLTKGPTEVLPLHAEHAVRLGLQNAREPEATFYAAAPSQAVTAK